MPTTTYTPIASQTLSSSASSVTFSSIPATYRDLVLIVDAKAATSSVNFVLRFNSDASNGSAVLMRGNGSTTSSFTESVINLASSSADTTNSGLIVAFIMDYSATDKHKTVLARGNVASSFTSASAARWASTSAITSIEVRPATADSYAANSSFYLYGIVS